MSPSISCGAAGQLTLPVCGVIALAKLLIIANCVYDATRLKLAIRSLCYMKYKVMNSLCCVKCHLHSDVLLIEISVLLFVYTLVYYWLKSLHCLFALRCIIDWYYCVVCLHSDVILLEITVLFVYTQIYYWLQSVYCCLFTCVCIVIVWNYCIVCLHSAVLLIEITVLLLYYGLNLEVGIASLYCCLFTLSGIIDWNDCIAICLHSAVLWT